MTTNLFIDKAIIIILIGLKFLYNLSYWAIKNSYNEESDKQLIEDSKEDSKGDGLRLFYDSPYSLKR